jgi:hypothetical protein
MKIPAFRTIARAYDFAFGNLATILGLIWLPLGLQAAASYLVMTRYFGALETLVAKRDFSALGYLPGEFFLFAVATLFLSAVIAVPVMRQALGERRGGAFVHFAVGAAEFRLFGANLAFSLMIATIAILAWFGLLALVFGARFAATAAGTITIAGVPATTVFAWFVVAIVLVFFGTLIFVALRLGFFVVPVTIAERKIDLVRAWTLTQGNFWRIVVVTLATAVPLWLMSSALQWAFLGTHGSIPTFFAPAARAPTTVPGTVAAPFQMMRDTLPIAMGISLFLAPLQYGLVLGAAAAAYRALVPPATSAPSSPGSTATGDLAPAAAAS